MKRLELCLVIVILAALALVVCGCETAPVVLRPPMGQNAERFGTDRIGTVNFHLARISAALDAEHNKVVELAERVRELEGKTDGEENRTESGTEKGTDFHSAP